MFKKIIKYLIFIFFIIVFVSLFNFCTSAASYSFSTIIMSVKHPLELSELNVEGYTIYTNNINYGVVGAYTITYQEKADKDVFVKRDVYIINDESTSYNSFGVEEERTIDIENFVSMDKRMINDDDYYLIIQYKHLDNYDIRVLLIIDGEIYFQNDFYPYEYVDSFVTFDEANDPIINLIIIDSYDENKNIKLLSLNYYEVETLTSFNLDRCLLLKYNQLNNGLYLLYEDRIVEIKLQNNKIIRTVNIKGSSLGYKFIDCFVEKIDDDFYYGYVFLDNDNDVYYYQLLNKDLEIYKTIKIDNKEINLYNNIFINNNNNVNYIFSYEIDNLITIDSEVGVLKYETYRICDGEISKGKIEFESSITDVVASNYGELTCLKIETENGNKYLYKLFLDMIMPVDKKERSFKDDFYYEYNDSNNKLKIGLNNKLDLIYKDKLVDKDGVLIRLDYPILFINGYECKLDLSLDYEKFGRYITNANLELDGFRVNLGYSYYVFDMCNVRDNEKYQIGTRIEFVGEGKLNGINIESGQKIETIGNYVLIIRGVDEEKYVSFEIKDLNEESASINNTDNNRLERIDSVSKSNNINGEIGERNSSYINNESHKDFNPYLYILMTFIITSIFVIGLRIIIKRKVNNNVK